MRVFYCKVLYAVTYFLYPHWWRYQWRLLPLFTLNLYNKKKITRWLEAINFVFSWWHQYFTHSLSSFVKYCFLHSKIKSLSSHNRLISSLYSENEWRFVSVLHHANLYPNHIHTLWTTLIIRVNCLFCTCNIHTESFPSPLSYILLMLFLEPIPSYDIPVVSSFSYQKKNLGKNCQLSTTVVVTPNNYDVLELEDIHTTIPTKYSPEQRSRN